jgi:hypothetical protein
MLRVSSAIVVSDTVVAVASVVQATLDSLSSSVLRRIQVVPLKWFMRTALPRPRFVSTLDI